MVSINVVRVPTAARALRQNHLLRAGDLMESLPAAGLPPNAIGSIEALVGRYLRVAKEPGDAFRPEDLGAGPILSYQNASLVSIGLPLQRALGGLLDPGIRLDVYGTTKGQGGAALLPERIMRDVSLVAVVKNEGVPDAPLILILALPTGDDGSQADKMCTKLVGAIDLVIVAHGQP